jgi:putative FmdB family regulatory protein
MPIYEYVCVECNTRFDARRAFSQADDPLPCPECGGSHVRRLLSTFFAFSSGGGSATAVAGTGGGCSSCASRACSTCGIARG